VKISDIAEQNEEGSWVCRVCGKDLGPGPHAVALAHWNNYHNEQTKAGRGFRGTDSSNQNRGGECEHSWRLLKPGDAEGRGQIALDAGKREWCKKCGKLR